MNASTRDGSAQCAGTRKILKAKVFQVDITPNTDARAVANDIATRFGWASGMRLRTLSISLTEPRTVQAIVYYEARGANANDVRRQIQNACPVAGNQIAITELVTINRDVDSDLIAACLLDIDEDDGETMTTDS
jgi:hypothetical protein